MKIVHLWRSEGGIEGGGGGIAMYRLHRLLKQAGISSQILCQTKTTNDPDVFPDVKPSLFDTLVKRFTNRLGLKDIHRLSSFNLKRHPAYRAADIVHIHGTHTGFLSYLALPDLTYNKAAVFTLHDMWAVTGGCHYSYNCDRWKIGCGQCPHPTLLQGHKPDRTGWEWRLKQWVYRRSNLVITAPSRWLINQVKDSQLHHFPSYHVPFGIDTTIYQPLDPAQARAKLGIPPSKKVLMFTATSLEDYRKGGDLLLQALNALPEPLKAETLLLTMGKGGQDIDRRITLQSVHLGYVADEHEKVMAYSAADLFLFPTRADAFGLVVQEAIACGTPIVAFNVGGVTDLVHPGVTGYLASPENVADFTDGIVQLLQDDQQRQQMGQNCRAIALEEYSQHLYLQRSLAVYRSLLTPQVG